MDWGGPVKVAIGAITLAGAAVAAATGFGIVAAVPLAAAGLPVLVSGINDLNKAALPDNVATAQTAPNQAQKDTPAQQPQRAPEVQQESHKWRDTVTAQRQRASQAEIGGHRQL